MIKIPRKLKDVKIFSGKSGFTLYAKRKTKIDAEKYQKRMQKGKTHLTRVIKTPKTSKDYKKGFKWEVWGRAK